MKTEIALFHFVLPLKKAIKILPAGSSVASRDIGILRLTKDYKIGFGEVSPLPGLSHETFLEISSLKNLNSPSLAFGMHCAERNMQEAEKTAIELCGLILEGEDPLKAVRFENEGYPVIKLKVGSNLTTNLQLIEAILRTTKKIKLRLDFNGRGEINALRDFLKDIPEDRIDYIEDPVPKNFLKEFKEKFAFKVAIDRRVDSEILNGDFTPVVKPTCIGISLAERLWAQKTPFILSSSFESNLGLSHLARGAENWNLTGFAHGLDTGKYFKENVFDLKIDGGSIEVPSNKWIREQIQRVTANQRPVAERAL